MISWRMSLIKTFPLVLLNITKPGDNNNYYSYLCKREIEMVAIFFFFLIFLSAFSRQWIIVVASIHLESWLVAFPLLFSFVKQNRPPFMALSFTYSFSFHFISSPVSSCISSKMRYLTFWSTPKEHNCGPGCCLIKIILLKNVFTLYLDVGRWVWISLLNGMNDIVLVRRGSWLDATIAYEGDEWRCRQMVDGWWSSFRFCFISF